MTRGEHYFILEANVLHNNLHRPLLPEKMWSLRANEIHGHGVADTPGNKLSSESDTDYKFLVRNAESVKNLKKPSIECRIRKKVLLET